MEKSESGKSRFNFIDVLIILTVLAIVAVIIYMTTQSGTIASKNEKTVVYTLKLSGVNSDYLGLISEGDEVFNSSTGNSIGKITAVRRENTKLIGKTIVTDSTGAKSISVSQYDNLYDVYVTLYVTASVDDRGIAYVDGCRILVGSRFYFRDATFAGTSFCTDFSIE